MKSVHQLVAGFRTGDAISNEALVFRRLFRSWGCASDIFSERHRVQIDQRGDVRDISEWVTSDRSQDVVLLHLSTGSPVNEIFSARPGRKVIRYHNITPPEFFKDLQDREYRIQSRGREQVRKLAGAATVNLAASRFNADELTTLGYRDVKVLPLLLDLQPLRETANPGIRRRYRDGLVNILCVGRCAPNKRIEDGLSAFYYFQKYIEPRSRFIYAGATSRTEPYYALLLTFLRHLQLHHVEFAGAVKQDELNAFYRCADLFLSMSEHEGFGIPLLESMVFDVPVLAYAAAAVPETLDGAGVLFHEKRYDRVAEMMGRLIRDSALQQAVILGQRERLARYEHRDLAGELRTHLQPLLV